MFAWAIPLIVIAVKGICYGATTTPIVPLVGTARENRPKLRASFWIQAWVCAFLGGVV